MVRRGCEIDEGGDEEADTDHIVRIHTDPSKDSVLKRVQKVSLEGSVVHTGDHPDISPLHSHSSLAKIDIAWTNDGRMYIPPSMLCYALRAACCCRTTHSSTHHLCKRVSFVSSGWKLVTKTFA